jgi:hypothetical protein
MSSAFVPFLKRGGKSTPVSSGATLPAMSDSAAGASAFAALVSNGTTATTATDAPNCAAGGKPTVSLQKEGDRVTQIRIQCSCGEVIELACDY